MLWLPTLPSVSSTGNTQKARERETTCSRKKTKTTDEIEDGDEDPGTPCGMRKSRVTAVAARKKGRSYQGVKYVFDAHTSKASKSLQVVLLHLWGVNVKTTGGFICISSGDFHTDKIAP